MLIMSMCLFTACPSDDDDESIKAVNSGAKVSSIEVYKNNKLLQIIKFYYIGNRIASADYSASSPICGPGRYRIFYNVSGSTMTISGSPYGQSSPIDNNPGKGILNSMGLLEEETFENSEYVIKNGKYCVKKYVHNVKGQVTEYQFYGSPTDNRPSVCTYKWDNDCIAQTTGNPGGNGNYSPKYTSIENQANINLNWMMYDQMFSEDIYGLALCGYISVKDRYLVEADWTFDKNGCATKAVSGGYTYVISY